MTAIRFSEDDIIQFGRGWLSVDKPPEMSVHNEPGNDLVSVVSGWIREKRWLSDGIQAEDAFGLHPIHRLDKDTSGVILLACQKEIFQYLSRELSERKIQKTYIAVLHGQLKDKSSEDSWGKWCWPLSKSSGGRKNPSGVGKKVESLTQFRILEYTQRYTVVECQPVTGRKHQIRRHARLAGHSILGDSRYGSVRSVSYLREQFQFSRLALHAKELVFTPKGEKQQVILRSSNFPLDIQKILDSDR